MSSSSSHPIPRKHLLKLSLLLFALLLSSPTLAQDEDQVDTSTEEVDTSTPTTQKNQTKASSQF